MFKPAPLHPGDHVAVVSLSAGTLGEPFAAHELKRGLQRLRALDLVPVCMPNSLKGVAYLAAHPEARAADLKQAFLDPSITGIICAIGGIETYRLAPYLLDDPEFVAAVRQHPKLFTGFSDTTVDHLMLYQLGLTTYYGPSLLNDFAELGPELLPYTAQTIHHYFTNPATTAITSSPVWYQERQDFSADALDTPRISHPETQGYQVLRGTGVVSGPLLGGCLDSLYSLITDTRYPDEPLVNQRYHLLPTANDFAGKLLFLETSEEQPTPATYRRMLEALKARGILAAVAGILTGKPQDNHYLADYAAILQDVTADLGTPLMANLNFGHAYPRTALPYGVTAQLDLDHATLTVTEPYFVGPVFD
ncbi:microcin C7 resistance MccF related protein [Levilactobacillus namurensis DSM 19117]|uniref:Microcin C7 resistance MccF related protein n=1 Tax=Levilactobacillus namurensis DSM 19117 TaxID=1423773 RepID=A0A0R1JWW4_9LACO|nr:S66 peptidase family protein [Levilactobacillus namurensis]KRK72849.1 microcin C7 resistance MccF related protein [Levilactobacillus namurensis DSM 19117]GEO75063.1 LD-carboxypeptidase [Levilactobacillus namurensis]